MMTDRNPQPIISGTGRTTNRSVTSKPLESAGRDVLAFDGKVVIVTGSTQGIGTAIASDFVSKGALVVVTGRSSSDVHRVVAGFDGRAVGISGDMHDRGFPDRLVVAAIEHFGRVDILVNNTGVAIANQIDRITDADIESTLEVNLASAIRTARAAGPELVKSSGCLINIGSIFAIRGRKDYSIYSASKAAMVGLTRSLAIEWAARGVRVNCVAPGYIATRVNEEARSDKELYDRILTKIPMRTFGEPTDVANAVSFLASPLARYISGQTLVVDGGFSIG